MLKIISIRQLGFSTLFVLLFLSFSCSSDDITPADPDDEMAQEEDEPVEIPLEARLAQVSIDTNGGTIVDEPKISSAALLMVGNDTVYNGNMGIEFRGASSQAIFPKKSYGLETWDENDEDINASLFDLPEEEDWILYGPYSDKTLIRNILIYDLSRAIGQYASRSLFVDLTIDDTYQGVYVFMEKLKRDGDRIDISKLNDDENFWGRPYRRLYFKD